MSQIVDQSANGTPKVPLTESLTIEALKRAAREHVPVGYLTTSYLAGLWDERSQQVDRHRQDHPEDVHELEARQRRATRALQAFRFLADLEQQLGFELALPVLGPFPGQSSGENDGLADLLE